MLGFGVRIRVNGCLIILLLTGFCFDARVFVNARTLDDYLIASTAHSLESSWLEDYLPEDYHEDVLQYLQAFDWEICPPVPDEIVQDICNVTPCTNETECQNNQHCCSNGCVFTCLDKLEPPAVVDWIREPKRRGGETSWLLAGADTIYPIQECSTSRVAGSNVHMLCPQGFTCKIEDKGNIHKDIPNRGICVAHKIQPKEIEQTIIDKESEGEKVVITGCQVNNKQYKDHDWFNYEKHRCKCTKGSVLCNVRDKRKNHKKKQILV